jgi:HlyD family secretion protein
VLVSKDPFVDLGKTRPRRWPWLLVLVVALGGGGYYWKQKTAAPTGPRYLTGEITQGDVREAVETTGTVQPMVLVQVGSQVSGRIIRVLVDFNASVRAGQLLAEIDPTPFQATVAQARASVLSAEASLQRARVNEQLSTQNLARARALRERNLNAQADLDAAVAQHDLTLAEIAVARAEGARARATLQTAQTNLSFTRIVAPIDGVVIQRSVDEGQTVAASLQAPVLFQIANDLRHMRIVANVDEADVARLRQGMGATARVDAFPRETFQGRVAEVRFGATTTAGVVTYPAVIEVANPDLKLRPGMTATVNVVSAEHRNVLRVPNAALRYRPAGRGGDAGVRRQAETDREGRGRVFVLREGRPSRVPVEVGLADEMFTEVRGEGLAAGAQVITEETEAASAERRAQGRTPGLMGGGGGGGGRRGMR